MKIVINISFSMVDAIVNLKFLNKNEKVTGCDLFGWFQWPICVFFLSMHHARSIFTSLIHGCTPLKMLFSYLLIHQESNQMCHFANARPTHHSLFLSSLSLMNIRINRERDEIYCAKDSYRILIAN